MEELLIIAVEKRPVLYDKTLTAYKNNNAREEAWKEVAAELKLGKKADQHSELTKAVLDFIKEPVSQTSPDLLVLMDF
ncbi:hypothetical protein NQ318_011824 [Aromia moschata]|uniref:MADF domain-containing protein n=1 Tax=Aromia moschata TaxID=1265417 RepID=A0AAV8XRF2_9CUCU|nr:hypothetical protein NQ318_011824 [Aromia moschata]